MFINLFLTFLRIYINLYQLITLIQICANFAAKVAKKSLKKCIFFKRLNFLKDPVVNFAGITIEHSTQKSK